MPVRLLIAIRVLKGIAIDAIDDIEWLDFEGALLRAVILRKCQFGVFFQKSWYVFEKQMKNHAALVSFLL